MNDFYLLEFRHPVDDAGEGRYGSSGVDLRIQVNHSHQQTHRERDPHNVRDEHRVSMQTEVKSK